MASSAKQGNELIAKRWALALMELALEDENISKVEIIDDYHLKSLDWGVIFEVSEKISPNITHMGIRAHDFSSAEKDDVNAFDTSNSTVLEMPFEWEVTLANGLWWKVDKQIHEHEFSIPEFLKIDPKDIILLEE